MRKYPHTPGPWEVQAGRSIVTKSGSFYLSYGQDKHGNPNFKDFCELDSNAYLVAASPDLLEACKYANEIIKVARRYFPKSMKNSDKFQLENTCAAIGKAVAKAEGE